MLQTNDIANLFKELFWALFHRMISRKFLDSMTIWYVIQKVSCYHRRIQRKFLDITLDRLDIQKNSVIYPIWVDQTESFGLINSQLLLLHLCFCFALSLLVASFLVFAFWSLRLSGQARLFLSLCCEIDCFWGDRLSFKVITLVCC